MEVRHRRELGQPPAGPVDTHWEQSLLLLTSPKITSFKNQKKNQGRLPSACCECQVILHVEEFFVLNTSGDATCDESFVEETIHAMKKVIFGSVLSVIALMLVSCASEPEATTTTTRQTTVTTPVAPPPSQTTTTTTHMGSGY